MLNINYTTQSQEKEIQENKSDIKDVKTKVEMLEEKTKFDISEWLKKNWPWLLITATLGIGWATNYLKI